jgi:hypothetical protein
MTCPSCKLPLIQSGAVFVASIEGTPFAFLVCHNCFQRLKTLPTGTRFKSLNRCADAVCRQPERHPHRAFQTEDEARAYAEVVADLLA